MLRRCSRRHTLDSDSMHIREAQDGWSRVENFRFAFIFLLSHRFVGIGVVRLGLQSRDA